MSRYWVRKLAVAEWPMTNNRIALTIGALLASTALALQEYASRHWGGGPQSFDSMLWAQVIGAAVWLALLPAVAVTRRAIAAASEVRVAQLGMHGAAALAIALLQ